MAKSNRNRAANTAAPAVIEQDAPEVIETETPQAEASVPTDVQEAPQADGVAVKKRVIRDVMRERLLAGDDTDAVLAAVYGEFPTASSGRKDVAFYRCQLRNEGALPPVVRLSPEQKKARKAVYEAEYKARMLAERETRQAAARAAAAEATPAEEIAEDVPADAELITA